jgi:pyruvate,water dikinase
LRQVSADLGLGVKAGSFFHFLRHLAGIAIQYRVPPRVARALISPGAAREQVKQMGEEMSAALSSPKAASRLERLEFVERVLQTEVIRLAPAPMPIAAAGIAMLALAGKLLGKSATQEDLQTVMRGLPYNVTTEMNLFLWQIAGRIRQDPTAARVLCEESPEKLQERFREGRLPEVAQRGVAEFLARYGVRAVAEIDAGMPRWSDEPAHIFGVLANYLRVGNPDMAPDAIFRRGVEEAEAMVTALTARARTRGRICGLLVRFALDRVRQLAGLRETPKYYIVMALGAIRRELAMIGTDLAAEGRIESAGDVFYLNLAEVRSAIVGADMRGRVPDRRETYLSELRRRHVPRVLLSDGTEPEARMASGADAAALRGTPASAGVVTGVARVVMEPTGAHLEPGEILVAPSTDPGWTPLFLTAGGLVMEMGGANSHGAVVAREYGIPAVVGVAGATLRVRSGQRISVDGGTGTVSLLEERAQ